MPTQRSILALFLILVANACGGSGGGGGGPFFGGIWKINTSITENSCETPPRETTTAELTVNQVGDEIAMESQNGNHYNGNVDGDDSFFASRQVEVTCVNSAGNPVPGSVAVATLTFRFANVRDDMANVRWTSDFSNCSGNTIANVACRIVEEGRATRTR